MTPIPLASPIKGFCEDHNISRSEYYNLKKRGLAPVEMKLGRKKLISVESAAEWRRRMEAPGGEEQAAAEEATT